MGGWTEQQHKEWQEKCQEFDRVMAKNAHQSEQWHSIQSERFNQEMEALKEKWKQAAGGKK